MTNKLKPSNAFHEEMPREKKPTIIKTEPFPNDNWTRVEIFLRAYGRLPRETGDGITQKTLDLFCKKWEAGKLKTKTVNLEAVYWAIKIGKVKIYKKET